MLDLEKVGPLPPVPALPAVGAGFLLSVSFASTAAPLSFLLPCSQTGAHLGNPRPRLLHAAAAAGCGVAAWELGPRQALPCHGASESELKKSRKPRRFEPP